MWQVLDGLFPGTNVDATDQRALKENSITHLLNCAVELPNEVDLLQILRLDMKDPDERMSDWFEETIRFIDEARPQGGGVLVYCQGAISRSPSIVLSYLCSAGMSLLEASKHLSTICPTRPNRTFLDQLALHLETKNSINWTLHD